LFNLNLLIGGFLHTLNFPPHH